VGIALAYVGVIFLAAAARPAGSLFFADLTRQGVKLNLFWLRLAFPFLVVGFATKAGLVPVHSWLPDAHAEAPAPISALLSGALLNGAMLAILRLQMVMDASGLAHTSGFLLILVGILSVFTAAACLRYVHNYKRMLAWSSVENMGIVVLGVGVGGAALFPTLLHILGHSLAKTACFLTAGWIHHQVDSKEIDESTGLFRRFPLLGSCWMASYSAISGFPPFLLFSSKIMLFSVLLDEGYYYLAASLAIALLIAICSLGQQVVTMVGGEVVENNQKPTADTQLPWSFIPIASLFLLLLIGSFYRPDFLEQLLNIAALVLSGGHDG
jgi:hydrogenase-4 component F